MSLRSSRSPRNPMRLMRPPNGLSASDLFGRKTGLINALSRTQCFL